MEQQWDVIDRKNRRTMRKAYPWASLSIQIHMDSLDSNPSLRSEKPAINLVGPML
jgi:hypothetical protein